MMKHVSISRPGFVVVELVLQLLILHSRSHQLLIQLHGFIFCGRFQLSEVTVELFQQNQFLLQAYRRWGCLKLTEKENMVEWCVFPRKLKKNFCKSWLMDSNASGNMQPFAGENAWCN